VSRPSCTLPPGKTRYPFYRRLGGPQGHSGQVWKILPPMGFDPQTVQPVGSRYTDYATQPAAAHISCLKNVGGIGFLSYKMRGSQSCLSNDWSLLLGNWFLTFCWIVATSPFRGNCGLFIILKKNIRNCPVTQRHIPEITYPSFFNLFVVQMGE
jgi:hypothetical protein